MAFDWKSLISPGIGAAAVLGGTALSNRSACKQSEREWALNEQERQRRNMIQGMAAPSMLRAIGYRDPAQIKQMTQQIGGAAAGGGAPPDGGGGRGGRTP